MSTSIGTAEALHATPGIRLPAPRTLRDAGLGQELMDQMVLKLLFFAGELSGSDVARRLGVLFGIVNPSLESLRSQQQCEVMGGTIAGGPSYRYRITTAGRERASRYLEQNQYVGVAPVPLTQYRNYFTDLYGGRPPHVTPEDLRRALGHLVLSNTVLDRIGPAVNGGRSLFIYGPPGNGKSVIARAIRSMLGDSIAVPHAIDVEGSIVRVFDPVAHDHRPPDRENGIAIDPEHDARWAVCRRPMITAGGELTLDALELGYESRLGYYRAPVQLAANGGVLIIDDFGRQRCRPHDLLNRWMVPLESGVDFLTLRSGLKFEVPFHTFIAFATNIRPSELVDEAFLRRVQHKVFAESPTPEQFIRIFDSYCDSKGLYAPPGLAERLLHGFYREHAITPRACHPRDLIDHALLLAKYQGQPERLTLGLLETVCASYFVEDRE